MLSVKGIYDGEVARPFREVQIPKGVEVIITFLTEKEEKRGKRWFEGLPIDREKTPRSLEEVQALLASIQEPLSQAVIEEREERALMGNHFLDTSALVKRYHLEAGTDEVNALFQQEDARVSISDLSIIEFHSALARKVRMGVLAEEDYWGACSFFLDEVRRGIFAVEEVGEGTKRRAIELLSSYALKQGLRTLDALQLAAALDIKEKDELDDFVSADGNLLQVAELAGLATLNPQG